MAAEEQEWFGELRHETTAARERQSIGSGSTWPMSGKEPIVNSGGEVMVRLLPHPHVINMFKGNKPNPEYKSKKIYFHALEHWFEGPDSKVKHAWCPRSLDPKAKCPLCDAAAEMLSSSEKGDRDSGYRIKAKDTYLINACVGPRANRVLKDNKVDIRLLPLNQTLFIAVSEMITGGESPDFARGDISRPDKGYELKLKRPAQNSNERWSISCAPESTPLYTAKEAEPWGEFADWAKRLLDPEAVVRKEMYDYPTLYKMLHGEPPPDGDDSSRAEDDEGGGAPEPWAAGSDETAGEGEGEGEEPAAAEGASNGAADGWPGFGMPDPEPKKPAAKPAAKKK